MFMTPQKTARQYQETQFATADRGTLLVLMFDGALRFLGEAEAGLHAQDVARFADRLGRAQAVIAELLHTLDHASGGEVAANLERLYRFMLEHLVEANLQKSPAHVALVRRLLAVVADAYREVVARGVPQGALDAA
ncbi:MAG: flagellar export chaperone FliS [Thermodesulfobacteriota bacterium]